MLNGLKNKILGMLEENLEVINFDPAKFQDELATKIDWSPCKFGGSNFKTLTYRELSSRKVGFMPSLEAKLFFGFFMVLGLVLPGISLFSMRDVLRDMLYIIPILPLGGLIFVGVGFFLFSRNAKPVIFDKDGGLFFRTWKITQTDSSKQKNPDDFGDLSNIHAIQLIREEVGSRREHLSSDTDRPNPYFSYELNLVLKNGERFNVADHGKKAHLIHDAEQLASFLGVPLWSAIPQSNNFG